MRAHQVPIGEVREEYARRWLPEGWMLSSRPEELFDDAGRHGLFNCYETSVDIVDSMFNQNAKWLKVSARPRLAAWQPPRTGAAWAGGSRPRRRPR
ncbi:hypothetical protein [Sphingopyxis chilensis]